MPNFGRVILNDRVLYRPLSGVGYYTSQLLHALNELAADDLEIRTFIGTFFARPSPGPPVPGRAAVPRHRESERWRGILRRAVEPAYEFAFRLNSRRFGLYHEPNHIPIETGTPTVTTVHDISVLVHPEWHPAHRVRWYERQFERGRRQTVRFIAASEFTRREMVERLNVPADRIDVTLQAARPEFSPRPVRDVAGVRRDLALPERFFLFVGTLEPRKNISTLLEAHAQMPPTLRRECPLVLVGGWGWKNEAIDEILRTRQASGEIRLLGYVDNPTLACLYSTCTALVWPTLYEGFGMPPLEAMACGGPVITSAVASLPEVAGKGALLLDPYDVPAWTVAMERMVEDAAWREQWRGRGLARAAEFSWQRCAEQTLECYRRAMRSIS